MGPRDHLGLRLFLEAKEMRGTQELQEPPGLKDGAGTLGPRAGLACSVSPEKKVMVPRGLLLSGRLAAPVRDGWSPLTQTGEASTSCLS